MLLSIPGAKAPSRRVARHSKRLRRGFVIAIADEFAVAAAALLGRGRGSPRAAQARQAAMYLAHVALGFGYRDIGTLFGRDPATVGHACRQVEDRRDDPAFDRRLSALERRLRPCRDGEHGKASQ